MRSYENSLSKLIIFPFSEIVKDIFLISEISSYPTKNTLAVWRECEITILNCGDPMPFIASNPQDRYRTMAELRAYEQEQDAKKDDFPFIQLTQKEYRLLKATTQEWVRVTAKNKNAASRLQDLVFVRTYGKDDDPDVEVCEIRNRGRNYLLYLNGIKAKNRIESIRYCITTAIAVLALVLAGISLAAQLHLIKLPRA